MLSFREVSGKLVEDFHLLNLILAIYDSNKNTKKLFSSSAQNTVILHNFLLWKFCGNAQLWKDTGKTPGTLRKLCVSTKFPHHEIRWNYGILRSVLIRLFLLSSKFWLQKRKPSYTYNTQNTHINTHKKTLKWRKRKFQSVVPNNYCKVSLIVLNLNIVL